MHTKKNFTKKQKKLNSKNKSINQTANYTFNNDLGMNMTRFNQDLNITPKNDMNMTDLNQD